MADENTENKVADTSEEQAKGAPEGVRNKDLSDGQSKEGSPAPKVNNEPPVKVPTAEEKAAAEKKTADETAAAKVVADKAAADAEAAKKTDGPTEYTLYNHEGADSAIATLKDAGVTPAEAQKYFGKAIETGKLEDIDKAGLIAKVGKDKATLILLGVTSYYNEVGAENAKAKEAVHTEVGGEANFALIVKWAQAKEQTDKGFASDLNQYRAMLSAGPTAARLAAKELKTAFNADPANKTLNAAVLQGDKAGNDTTKGISRADYIVALKAAEGKGDRAEIARLNAARMAGKKAGL